MFNLLPQEDKFYRMLKELEHHAGTSCRLLKILVERRSNPDAIKEASEGITRAKREAKKVLESVNQEICRTLITPFDREDIQQFATDLYHTPKLVEKIKDRMLTHDLHPFNGDFNKFIDIIERQAEAMAPLVKELSGKLNTKTINAKAAILHELEDQGDVILGQLIASSFHDIADTRELIGRMHDQRLADAHGF